MLKDIAILTGGTYISGELNMNLLDVQVSDAGPRAPGQGHQGQHHHRRRRGRRQAEIKARVARSRTPSDPSPPPTTTRKSCRSALPSSSGGVAVIKVGAQTEVAR
jgi:chaperonin GroEL